MMDLHKRSKSRARPGTSVRGGKGSVRESKLQYGLLVIALCVIYYIGYRNGQSMSALTSSHTKSQAPGSNVQAKSRADDSRTELDELGLSQDTRVAMGLTVLQNAQGFSEAYPVYQNEKAEVANKSSVKELEDNLDQMDTAKREAPETMEPIEIGADGIEDKDLFEDYDAYIAAPEIVVPTKALRKKNLWWAVKAYEKYYASHPVKRYVPRIRPNIQLTLEEFHQKFRREGRPVLFTFENLRNLGFKTRSYTIDELKALFPFDDAVRSRVQQEFVANGVRKDDQELDLGPALVAIEKDEELAKQGKLRNFPRNLKVKQSAIHKLGIDKPPLIQNMEQYQLPTVWMGTSTSDTRFHHDCCDNFVMMIMGTKRFTLAPPSDWRTLNPSCVGTMKNLCWANVAYPNNMKTTRHRRIMDKVHSVVVDVRPGEVLYMPAGWFHHIENLGPTVMVNWWTKQGETIGLLNAIKNPQW